MRKRAYSALAMIVAAVMLFPAAATGEPASPMQEQFPEYLTVRKSVNKEELQPGDSFTYSIYLECQETTCLNAELVDDFPAELAGWPIDNVSISPAAAEVPREVTWFEGDTALTDQPAELGADTSLFLDVRNQTPDGEGMEPGQTLHLQVTLQVPQDLPGGTDITAVNHVSSSADNSAPDADEATVTVNVPGTINAGITKNWDPSSQYFEEGAESAVTLAATNSSNIPVSSLVVQDPATAVDGADTLDANNPFSIVDLASLDGVSLPAGADTVQVDTYVLQADGTYAWVPGTADETAALPAGVDAADVAGLRFTFASEIEAGASTAIDMTVGQRATDRNDGSDLSVARQDVTNIASATAIEPEYEPVTVTDNAPFAITPAPIEALAAKDIQQDRIGAGQSASATLTGVNQSGVPVAELVISDRDFFTDTITFDGFTAAPTWPAGATDAAVVYHPLDGGDPITTAFTNGATPADPGVAISGFDIVFTGTIAVGASADAAFDIATTEDAAGAAPNSVTLNNDVSVEVTAPNGLSDSDTDRDSVVVIAPGIDVTLTKDVRPNRDVYPGETVVASLVAQSVTSSDWVTNKHLIIEDVWNDSASNFWNGFELSSMPSTEVPANVELSFSVQVGDTWHEVSVFPAETSARFVSLNASELDAALASLTPAVPAEDVTGVRFEYSSDDGLPATFNARPYVGFTALEQTRLGEDLPDVATEYENAAVASGNGETGNGTPVIDEDFDVDTGAVVPSPSGPGPIDIVKSWTEANVIAQSGQERSTTLTWSITAGYENATITDPSDPTINIEESVYDSFDLKRIDPINASNTPYSNGWFLKYDTIESVRLYDGSTWVDVAAPSGGWIQNGRFVGYELTAAERESTVGFQIVLGENTDARTNATDPYAPEPGTGVSEGSGRAFTLDWEIRNKTRSAGIWVEQGGTYNTANTGEVLNTVELEADPIGDTPPVRDTDADEIQIINGSPNVRVDKSVSIVNGEDQIYVPAPGADPSLFQEINWTVKASSMSASKASYLSIVDPPQCDDMGSNTDCQVEATAAGATTSPFDLGEMGDATEWLDESPFNRVDLTGLQVSSSRPGEVDLAASPAWLLRYDEATNTLSVEDTTVDALPSMTAEELQDVIGVAVTFQGSDPAETGGTISSANEFTITYETKLRETLRHDGSDQTFLAGETANLTNRVFAQSFDPVLADGEGTGALDPASVVLTGGEITVAPGKSVSPSLLIEPERDTPVTVTLSANSGTTPRNTLSPVEVWIRDDNVSSPDFWNSFTFTGLGTISAPSGSDQAVVSVYGPFGDSGAMEWIDSAPTALDSVEVPVGAEQYADIQGIEVTFTRADGGLFSQTLPAASWNASIPFTVELRDTFRDSGEEIAMEGTVENTVTVQAIGERDRSPEVTADAVVELSPGTQEIKVNKLANEGRRTVNVGVPIPWDLTVQNSGTGYLTLTELRDELPDSLLFSAEHAPVYEAEDGGTLSEDVTLEERDGELVFTWPEDGNIMQPGETFKIRIHLELQPGLQAGQEATNVIVANTVETLDQCGNTSPYQGNTGHWTKDPTSCGTSDFVQPTAGMNLYAVKGVMGSLDGAVNSLNADLACTPNLTASDGADYYRYPCIANSAIGGTDSWVLRTVNAGTTNMDELVIFDQLPVAGDKMYVSGGNRGSDYRPQITEAPTVYAPEGATYTVEVTSSSDVCTGTWSNLENQEPCEQNGETWLEAANDTDWSTVSGIRIHVDFAGTDAGTMLPGNTVDVTFETENAPATAADPSGASVTVPVENERAINQFGVRYLPANTNSWEKLTPAQVGVQLPIGSIAVTKDITGPAAAYAPSEFRADVQCTIEGAPVDLGDYSTVVLTEANEWTVQIDGIPYGAECTVTEQGDLGEFGETSRSIENDTLQVLESVAAEGNVPQAQITTLSNDYQFGDLSVSKTVKTDADLGEFGPFDFALTCQTLLGNAVTFDDAGTAVYEFTLEDGETVNIPANTIPVGSLCELTEVGSNADSIVYSGLNVTADGDTATIGVLSAVTPTDVSVTNGYDAGQITLEKMVDGEGAEIFGTGEFGFDLVCIYNGDEIFTDSFSLVGGGTYTTPSMPAGTSCSVVETTTGGATSTSISPAEIVVPTQDSEELSSLLVTATNTFDVGELVIDKQVVGEGADLYGAGPFEAQAQCIYDVDGVPTPVVLANEGRVTLNEANGYTATIGNLPIGADCTVTETLTGGATSTEVSGDAVIANDPAVVTVTNTFDVGELVIDKQVVGEGADLYGAGPFEAQVQCVYDVNGANTSIALANGGLVALTADNGYTATIGNLPIGADCTVTETKTGGATSTEVSGSGNISATPAVVTVTNTFDVGELVINKELVGDGAELYGVGPFEAQAQCVYNVNGVDTPITLADDGIVPLTADNDYTATIGNLPIGAECTVVETVTGGATATEVSGAAVIAHDPVVVMITNTFDVGSISIVKEIEGGAADHPTADRTFEITASIDTTAISEEFPDPADRTIELTEGVPFIIDDLPVGSTITFEEAVLVDDDILTWGEPVFTPESVLVDHAAINAPVEVTLTNSVERTLGTFSISKIVTGDQVDNATVPATVTINATWDEEGTPGSKTLEVPTDGTPVPLGEDLLIGTEVTLTEVPLVDGSSIAWADPAWSGDNVEIDGSSVVVTVSRNAEAAVVVENHAATSVAGLSIIKGVAGEAAEEVAPETEFPVTVTWTDADGVDQVRELTINAVEPTPLGEDLPAGTVVTITEGERPGFGTVIWDEIVISGDNVTDNGDGSAEIVVSDQQGDVTLVTVTNEATWAPGTFTLVKHVEGVLLDNPDAPELVTINATWIEPDEETGDLVTASRSIEVPTDGTAVDLGEYLPHGTEVTLVEDALGDNAAFTWAAPIWSETDGLVINEDGSATLTIAAAQNPTVELTNVANATVGNFSIVKELSGSGADLVPADTVFPVTATWTDILGNEQSAQLKLVAGEPATIENLPFGTEVTLTEGEFEVPATVTWEEAEWSADSNVMISGEGTEVVIVVEDEAGVAVSVTLDNEFNEIPEDPQDPEGPEEPKDPADPKDPDLPVTGADVRNAIVLGLLLLAAGFVALYTARRKNT
ncbi:MAG: DUF5979 domain-containing protein [Flaviflexus sp.]|uniref:DUF5979 domain-containing protein n=1 Tax=Flaviflexus sp. TaxID=1969482 RepID=UPI003F8E0CC3